MSGEARVAPAQPRRIGAALLLATLVTLAATVPLTVLAWQARSEADTELHDGLVLATDEARPLHGATLAPRRTTEVVLTIEDLTAASWAVTVADGERVADGAAHGQAPLALGVGPILAGLEPGVHDLLVTASLADGSVVKRAARFEIGDVE